MSEYRLGFSVTKIGILSLINAYLIMAATTRPLPTPVWSPIMNPLPSSAFLMANAIASICSAEKLFLNVSGSILRLSATYSSMLPCCSSSLANESSIAWAIALGTNVPTDDAFE